VKESEVAAFWDANAPLWDEFRRKGYDTYRLLSFAVFQERLGSIKGQRLVDLGCGEGYNTRIFAESGAQMIGIDISSQMIACAKEREEKEPLGIEYHEASASNLSFLESGSVDGVVSTLAIMDMPDIRPVFQEVFRIIREGGFFQFSVLHPVLTSPEFERVLNEKGEKRGCVIGNYFQENDPSIQKWHFTATSQEERKVHPPFTMPFFHRTLSTYFSLLREVGFQVESLDEPRASSELCKQEPSLIDTTIYPYFLIMRCMK